MLSVRTELERIVPCAPDAAGFPADLEFHGSVLWNAGDHWSKMEPRELLAVYKDVIDLLEVHDVDVSHASIGRTRLHAMYDGGADKNAYLLALQFMFEKIDRCYPGTLKILIADEQKEHQLRAMKMVKDMQIYGLGEVPGFPIKTIIDSIHFVDSAQSPGIQMVDIGRVPALEELEPPGHASRCGRGHCRDAPGHRKLHSHVPNALARIAGRQPLEVACERAGMCTILTRWDPVRERLALETRLPHIGRSMRSRVRHGPPWRSRACRSTRRHAHRPEPTRSRQFVAEPCCAYVVQRRENRSGLRLFCLVRAVSPLVGVTGFELPPQALSSSSPDYRF